MSDKSDQTRIFVTGDATGLNRVSVTADVIDFDAVPGMPSGDPVLDHMCEMLANYLGGPDQQAALVIQGTGKFVSDVRVSVAAALHAAARRQLELAITCDPGNVRATKAIDAVRSASGSILGCTRYRTGNSSDPVGMAVAPPVPMRIDLKSDVKLDSSNEGPWAQHLCEMPNVECANYGAGERDLPWASDTDSGNFPIVLCQDHLKQWDAAGSPSLAVNTVGEDDRSEVDGVRIIRDRFIRTPEDSANLTEALDNAEIERDAYNEGYLDGRAAVCANYDASMDAMMVQIATLTRRMDEAATNIRTMEKWVGDANDRFDLANDRFDLAEKSQVIVAFSEFCKIGGGPMMEKTRVAEPMEKWVTEPDARNRHLIFKQTTPPVPKEPFDWAGAAAKDVSGFPPPRPPMPAREVAEEIIARANLGGHTAHVNLGEGVKEITRFIVNGEEWIKPPKPTGRGDQK